MHAALATKLAELVADRQRREAFRSASRKAYEKSFSLDDMIAGFERVYRKALARQGK